jgi:ABC-type glycerol-3-phosphate transport system substrate-binding protein
MKRIISLACAAVLLLSMLAGCGAAKTENPGESGAKPAEQSTTDAQAPVPENSFDKPVEFSFASFGTITDDEFTSFLSKKFNVKIEPQALDWNNWEQQVNTMMASGDMPDILQWDHRANKIKMFKQWVDGGLLKTLPDLSKYPNLKALRDKMIVMNYFQVDGKDYLWTKLRGDNKWNLTGPMSFVYRKDWAEKLGMAKDEYTVDEFIALANAFAQKDPAGNGAGKTAGYTDVGWAFPYLLNYYNPYASGLVKKDGKYIWGATLPETLEGLKALREMYKAGGLWKDFYTAKDYDGNGLYMANRLGIWSDNLGSELVKFRTDFKNANPNTDPYEAVAVMKVRGKDGKYYMQEWDNTWSAYLYSASLSDEEMDRIFAIMDWAAGEEGTRMCQFGFEGTDYELKDGQVVTKWQKDDKGAIVKPAYMTTADAVRNIASLNGDFMYSDPNMDQKSVKDLTDLYKLASDFADQVTLGKLNYDLDFFSAPNKDKYLGTLGSDFKAMAMKAIVSTDDVEGELNKFIQANQEKVNAMLKEINDAGVK